MAKFRDLDRKLLLAQRRQIMFLVPGSGRATYLEYYFDAQASSACKFWQFQIPGVKLDTAIEHDEHVAFSSSPRSVMFRAMAYYQSTAAMLTNASY